VQNASRRRSGENADRLHRAKRSPHARPLPKPVGCVLVWGASLCFQGPKRIQHPSRGPQRGFWWTGSATRCRSASWSPLSALPASGSPSTAGLVFKLIDGSTRMIGLAVFRRNSAAVLVDLQKLAVNRHRIEAMQSPTQGAPIPLPCSQRHNVRQRWHGRCLLPVSAVGGRANGGRCQRQGFVSASAGQEPAD
jgi:hypothetical protein